MYFPKCHFLKVSVLFFFMFFCVNVFEVCLVIQPLGSRVTQLCSHGNMKNQSIIKSKFITVCIFKMQMRYEIRPPTFTMSVDWQNPFTADSSVGDLMIGSILQFFLLIIQGLTPKIFLVPNFYY